MRLQSRGLVLLAVIITAQALSLPPLPSLPAIAIPEFPPWVWIGMVFNGANTIQTAKKNSALIWRVLTGGKGAACTLCDEVVTRMLDLTGGGDAMDGSEELDCDLVCPFRIKKCVAMCTKLKEAISSSQHYPCMAIGLCPEVDEFGEVPSCKFQWKKGSCQPSNACKRTRLFPFPKCELNPGFKKWRKYTSIMSNNVNALAAAVKRLPRCGEKDADVTFCINEPVGWGMYAEYLGYVLVFVVATFRSVRAIETPGGDDDRQWLTFWMIYFAFTFVERVSAVLLSWFPLYYQFKLVTLAWLIFWEGAALLYTKVHQSLEWLMRRCGILLSNRAPGLCEKYEKYIFWNRKNIEEEEYIAQLEKYADYSVLHQLAVLAKEKGIDNVYRSFESPKHIVDAHGPKMLEMLHKKWDELEVRCLEVTLMRATDLPPMDSTIAGKKGRTDAYCVFSLVPPSDKAKMTESQELIFKRRAFSGLQRMYRAAFRTYYKQGKGPRPRAGEYGSVRSRTVWKTLNPVWNQLLELQVLGGAVDDQGVYRNRTAPFTQLRVEVWDQDRFSFDDFVGEFTIPLTILMDGRKHRVSEKLTDPDGIRAGAQQGEVFLELRYNS